MFLYAENPYILIFTISLTFSSKKILIDRTIGWINYIVLETRVTSESHMVTAVKL